MKNHLKNLFLLPALIAGLTLIPAGRVTAQTHTTLHLFTFPYGDDGRYPRAGLVLSGNTLYGTSSEGGTLSPDFTPLGTVFAVNTDGTGYRILHRFSSDNGNPYNRDGFYPYSGLVLSGNTLYGTTFGGGGDGAGTVFAVNTDGTGFTIVHTFVLTSIDGGYPLAGLILSGNTLYGTTWTGGISGTVFAVNTDGTGFTTLHTFTATSGDYATNSDGANPVAGLILSGDTLYGTANKGGTSGYGTIFAVNIDGSGFTTLHSFTAFAPQTNINSDGGYPRASLILSGNTLYGTAELGGSSGNGTVFAVNTDGTDFTTLHSFTDFSDGAQPDAGLILSGNTLYGTAQVGGWNGGTVFAINTDGTGYTTLHRFLIIGSGYGPVAGLALAGNTLYGTALSGGMGGGDVFSLSLPLPQLTLIRSFPNVILTWPSAAAGFTLQSTPDLVSQAVWSTVFPAPVIVNGLNTVTIPISGPQEFFRLSL